MNHAARRFALLTLGLAAGLCISVGLLNYFVDPYNRYGRNSLGVYISAERESKATDVRRYPHDALLLGNSRMAMIPVEGLRSFYFFNAAFGGGTAAEAYFFAQRFATNIELVVLGIELGQYAGTSSSNDNPFTPPNNNEILNNLLNMKTVEYSARTIAGHFSGESPALRPDGSFNAKRWFELYDRPNPIVLDRELLRLKLGYSTYSGPVPGSMKYYARLAQLLRERHVHCVVFLPPLHQAVATSVKASPSAMKAYQDWKRELDLIFPTIVDLSLGQYCAAENFFQSDPVHFKPEAGVRMLNEEVLPVALQTRP